MRNTLILATVLLAGCQTEPTRHWEYSYVSAGTNQDTLHSALQESSGTDWELVAVPVRQNGEYTLVFKRPMKASGE